jgi:hypothetical protein
MFQDQLCVRYAKLKVDEGQGIEKNKLLNRMICFITNKLSMRSAYESK